MEPVGETLTKYGTVVFLETNQGSKSGGVFPFLYESRNLCGRIWLEGDKSFCGDDLLAYDGSRVEAVGCTGRGGVFVISAIKVCDENK